VLSGQNQITAAQQNLASQESNAAAGQMTSEVSSAQTPSWLDEFGANLANAPQNIAKAAGGAAGG
jgi:hypothetical protein